MKHLLTALVLSAAAGAVFAQAAAPTAAASKAPTAQQQKMGDCASQNKGKKGDDYKAGMKACMSGAAASAAASGPAGKTMTPQQQKMSDCAKANKGKTGDEQVLFDPNEWSKDGSVSLGGWQVSWDGKLVAAPLPPRHKN